MFLYIMRGNTESVSNNWDAENTEEYIVDIDSFYKYYFAYSH
jgi:hypothetical protein